MRILALAAILAGLASPALGAEMRCDISSKFACSPSGCVENTLGAWNLINFDAARFSRCDRNGCDHYSMSHTVSGIFTNIEVPGRAMIAKMTGDGFQYVEVVTLGTDVLVSYGSCR